MLWSGLESVGVAFVSLAVSVVLARLVAPEAFGIIAVLQVFVIPGQVFAEAGMSQALVRLPHRAPSHDYTALTLNVVLAVLVYMLMWACAPLIAGFYSKPELAGTARLLALSIPLASLCVVQTARLSTRMQFGRLSAISIAAVAAGGVTGTFMAVRGAAISALVWQQLTTWGMRALLLWTLYPMRAPYRFSLRAARSLAAFSWNVMVANLVNAVFYNSLHPMLVGRFIGVMSVALFWRALTLARVVPQNFCAVLNKVMLPALSMIRNEPARKREAYSRLISCSSWAIVPVCMLAIALAEPLFVWVLTDKWSGAVPLFRVLLVSHMMMPVQLINCTALNVEGRSGTFMHLEVLKKVIEVIIICICLPMGLLPFCIGIMCSTMITWVLNVAYARPCTGLGHIDQIRLLLPSVAGGLLASAAALCVSSLFQSPAWKSLSGLAVGAGVYLFYSRLAHLSAPVEIKGVLLTHKHSQMP